jgi:hypothetical protein
MQGVGLYTPNSSFYGNYQFSWGKPGAYEFLIIGAPPGPTEVVFKNNILNTYDPASNIQMVRVPYFNSATVDSKLFCDSWNAIQAMAVFLPLLSVGP